MNEMTKTPARTPTATSLRQTTPMGWLRGEIDRLFDDFGGSRSLFDFGPSALSLTPTPALELTEGDNEYRLTAELPGLTEKDVTIDVTDGVLTIAGEKKEEEERKSDGYILNERRYGSFKRQIGIPADVDADGIKAKFDKGVLNVTLAKNAAAAPRTRKIEIGA